MALPVQFATASFLRNPLSNTKVQKGMNDAANAPNEKRKDHRCVK
jgi:hypothetical protein